MKKARKSKKKRLKCLQKSFLAYFQILKKYAIVRALSVRLSVRAATTFQGVDRSCPFMAQSKAYDARA